MDFMEWSVSYVTTLNFGDLLSLAKTWTSQVAVDISFRLSPLSFPWYDNVPSPSSPDHLFYLQNAVCVALWWVFICWITKRPVYEVLDGSVVTIPSWLAVLDKNNHLMLFLQRHARPPSFFAQTTSFALAMTFPHQQSVRILSAVLYAVYHLVESSVTNRHGEYPILYCMWALCLIPDQHAKFRQPCGWGIAIHFVLSAGYAKLAVGGGAFEWIHPSTMRCYLNCYRHARHGFNRPLIPTLNRMVAQSKVLSSAIAICILVFECLIVPGSLFMAPAQRLVVAYLMMVMHIAISLILSLKVGVAFWTSIPCYWYGFSCTADFRSEQWWVALIVGIGPTILAWCMGETSSRGSLLPDDWPLTSASLFLWNGPAAENLSKQLMVGDTRMVLMAEEVATKDLLGRLVLQQGEMLTKKEMEMEGAVVHDAVMRTIGFTMVQGGHPIIDAVQMMQREQSSQRLFHRTCAWLNVENGRLVDIHSGDVLSAAAIVKVDTSSARIVEVVHQ